MAIRNREEFINELKARYKDSTEDDVLQMIVDIDDTLNDYETRVTAVTNARDDWERKYNENETAWIKRYRDRFFNKITDEDVVINPTDNEKDKDVEKDPEEIKIDDLFVKEK